MKFYFTNFWKEWTKFKIFIPFSLDFMFMEDAIRGIRFVYEAFNVRITLLNFEFSIVIGERNENKHY